MDRDAAALQFEFRALARQVIGALAVDLDGAEPGRGLVDLAEDAEESFEIAEVVQFDERQDDGNDFESLRQRVLAMSGR
jgi:hypothetical protein